MIAQRISLAINNATGNRLRSSMAGLGDRPNDYLRGINGAVYRTDLVFLNSTQTLRNAIMPEICFIDNPNDMAVYDANFNRICQAIANELTVTALRVAES